MHQRYEVSGDWTVLCFYTDYYRIKLRFVCPRVHVLLQQDNITVWMTGWVSPWKYDQKVIFAVSRLFKRCCKQHNVMGLIMGNWINNCPQYCESDYFFLDSFIPFRSRGRCWSHVCRQMSEGLKERLAYFANLFAATGGQLTLRP